MSQKLENLLNLALQTPEEQRIQTDNLNIGFNSETRTWELIVKYHGSLDRLGSLNVEVEYLIAGYAILTVPEQLVELVAELEEIEYVEKPKGFSYGVSLVKESSCILPVTVRPPSLSGTGVLIAVLDSGIDYRRDDFRYADGTTRIQYLWDQTLRPDPQGSENTQENRDPGNTESPGEEVASGNGTVARRPPQGFNMGVEFDREQINMALQVSRTEGFQIVPSIDVSGHGTAVAGIAAGRGSGTNEGVAPGSELLIVKLGVPDRLGFPRTTEIMRGVTYAVNKAIELKMPMVVNLSFGNTYGSHDGSSLLERFLDNAAEIGRTVFCVGSGNEGNTAGHVAGNIMERKTVELAVGEYETSLSVQLWKNYSDRYTIRLRTPGGTEQEVVQTVKGGKLVLIMEQTQILIYVGEPAPYSVSQEIYFDMIPVGRPYINSGVWQFIIEPVEVVTGQYYLYLPGSGARSGQSAFYRPTPQVTLTIPSTASKVITVGAYDSVYDSYADFSGRGYADSERTIGVVTAGLSKPDLAAPGVGIMAPDLFGGYQPVTGTSFATPIVSGSAALLMEWGIVKGNDIFLYGEKVKAYLRKGARPLRGEVVYPNDKVGFGALCVSQSLPL